MFFLFQFLLQSELCVKEYVKNLFKDIMCQVHSGWMFPYNGSLQSLHGVITATCKHVAVNENIQQLPPVTSVHERLFYYLYNITND